MSIPNLPVNFKDDILAASNPKRKYQQTFNSDGSVSLEDVTVYTQQGSGFGASQVNQTNGAINNIYNERILDLDELELVTEPGFFVDAKAVKESYDELNSKIPFGGQAIARNGAIGANVVHANVTFDSPMKNADYRAVAILVSGGLNDYDANYDVNVSISKKTVSGFTIDIHRGTDAMLEANGTWILDYIVLP